ncbi:MAG TPA: hypothetical protein VF157_16450, partial [Chloroflexota bacterium]
MPAFEAPDEPGHYAYVQWLLEGHGVPLQGQEPPPLQPEFSQPPLYYLVETPLAWLAGTAPANLPDWERQHNPFQNATESGNVNLFFHTSAETFPWRGALLGLHLMRLANVLFVALMVLATYGCGLELGWTPGLAWCAAAMVGFLPQLLFIGGVLNADNAIGSLSAASLFLLLRWWNRGPSPALAALLGLALGLAALSKLSGLVAVAVAGVTMVGRACSRRKTVGIRDLAIIAAAVTAVAGWWYARNWSELGDPLGWTAMLPATGEMLRQPPLGFGPAALELLRRWYTGLAVFGWTNLPLHWVAYWLFAMLGLWGVVALLVASWRAFCKGRIRLEYGLLGIWSLAFFVSLARWIEVNTAADQWRLLFPAYPAAAVLLVAGLANLLGRAWKLLLALPAGLLALNVGAIVVAILPAYALPGPYVGPIEHPLQARFGDRIELLGYSTPQPMDVRAGGTVEVDLFWRALAAIDKVYADDLATVDAQSRLTWKAQSAPDEGRAPMLDWHPGEVVRDRWHIQARPEMLGAQTLLLSVLDPVPPGDHLPAAGADGQPLANASVTLGRFLVLPGRLPAPASTDRVDFQDHLQLAGHTMEQAGGQLRLTLDWRASGTPGKDYTVFVHLVSADGRQVGQSDGQPGGGAFPTSLLAGGTDIPDVHIIDVSKLAPGDYRLEVGLYELATGARLS